MGSVAKEELADIQDVDLNFEQDDTAGVAETSEQTSSGSNRCVEALKFINSTPELVDPANLMEVHTGMISLFEDDKILRAGKELERLTATIGGNPTDERCQQYKLYQEKPEVAEKLSQLRASYEKSNRGLREFISHEDWIFSQEMFGYKTWYRSDGGGILEVKMEALMKDVDATCLMAAFREADLYKSWVPFCTSSRLLKRDGRSKTVFYVHTPIPLLNRDAVMSANFVDATDLGFFTNFSESINEYPGVEIPECNGWFLARVWFYAWNTLLEPQADGSLRVMVILKVDLKSSLPSSLLQFVMRKVCGVFLWVLARAARKYEASGEKSPYHPLVTSDNGFYRDYFTPLMAKCLAKAKQSN